MFDSYFPYTDERFIGAPIVSRGDEAYIYVNYPGHGRGYQFPGKNIRAGYGTGRYGIYDGRYILQVLLEFGNDAYGYVFIDDYSASLVNKQYSRESAQELINTIVENNQKIVENNLVSARLITLLEKKGIPVPEDIKANIRQLQTNVQLRDERLKENEWLTGRKTGSPAGASAYLSDLNKLMNPGVGIAVTISITTVIIISVVATLIISTLLYFAFFDSSKAALNDYKVSQKYLNVLAGLDEESRKIVESEMSSALKYGYRVGGNSLLKNIGILAAGAGILLLAKPVRELITNE